MYVIFLSEIKISCSLRYILTVKVKFKVKYLKNLYERDGMPKFKSIVRLTSHKMQINLIAMLQCHFIMKE
jgi:hypothetical protein